MQAGTDLTFLPDRGQPRKLLRPIQDEVEQGFLVGPALLLHEVKSLAIC